MHADFSIELGADDATLEFPWAAPGGGPRYYDVKRRPGALALIKEAARFPELGEFLSAVNSPAGPLETAKCDVWAAKEITPEEEIFGEPWKFGSYVDLLFSDADARFSFDDHRRLVEQWTVLVKRAPEIPAAAEFFLRRCFYHEREGLREGFYVTFYEFGYGANEMAARQQWGIGLKLAAGVIGEICYRDSAL
jgi:hypothetical protein